MSDFSERPSVWSYFPAAAVLAIGLVAAGWILGSQIKQTKLGDHYVTVKGLVERTVKSDLAIWTISFQEAGDDFKSVLDRSESDKQKVLSFLAQQGVSTQQIQLQPPRVIDKQAREYGARQAGESRYLITQSIVVTSPDVDRIAAANQKIGELLQQGIILAQGSGVSFQFTGLNAIKPDMITEATKNAREAAQRFANDAGAKVGSIRQASQGTFSISAPNPSDVNPGEGGDGGSSADASITKVVRVVTTVQYYLD